MKKLGLRIRAYLASLNRLALKMRMITRTAITMAAKIIVAARAITVYPSVDSLVEAVTYGK